MQFEMIQVRFSTSIRAVGYDRETETLRVVFTSGAEYLYRMVPEKVFMQLLEAKSRGQFFADKIRWKFTGECVKKRDKKEKEKT